MTDWDGMDEKVRAAQGKRARNAGHKQSKKTLRKLAKAIKKARKDIRKGKP